MPMDFMYMLVQIPSFGMDIIFDLASYLANEIHNGLIRNAKGKLE